MEKTCFCTLATGDYYDCGGTANLVKSAKRFHPEIPFFVFSDQEMKSIFDNYDSLISQAVKHLPQLIKPLYPKLEMGFYHCLLGKVLSKEYDLIVYIDCDSLITAPLTEVFNEDYDIACVRNIADNGKAGCFRCVVEGIDPLKYVNGGFTASRSKIFWDYWILLNIKDGLIAPFAEQFTLNCLFHSGIFNALLLDPPESKVYYGLASAYGENTHWDSWQRITIEDNLLKLDGKTIKILHEAGGPCLPKMDGHLLPQKIGQWIKNYILGDLK